MRIPLALGVAAALALATTSEEVEVDCPVCGNEFFADEWHSTNSVGGQDRDFLQHAAGGQVFLMICWTCPRCRYTGYPDAFGEDAPAEPVARLKRKNPLAPAEPIDPKLRHCGEIPAWVRYDLLLQVLALQPDASPSTIASACRRVAHAQRFEWSLPPQVEKRTETLSSRFADGIPKGLGGYERAIAYARAYEKLAADPEADLPDAERDAARVLAALLYKTRGEDPAATRALSALAGKKLAPELRAVVADIETRIAREKTYHARALPHLEAMIRAAKAEKENATGLRYLVGVLHGKLGAPGKARAWLEPLLADETVPEGFRAWIEDELAKAKRGG